MKKRIQILDCTLRDGGLGLEDAYINKIADVGFSEEDANKIIEHFSKSNIDIIELGSIEISENDKKRFAIYQDIESVSRLIPKERSQEQMYVALYRGPDTPLDRIPQWDKSLVDGVRVILRYSELEKSLNFCAALCEKGYKVFVQPMLTMRYTDDELDMIVKASNEMGAYALYFVDSYGYMQNRDVERLFRCFDKRLSKDIKIGFHAHNNMNLAFSNVQYFIDISSTRDIIIDSCAIGMGQGAGNLQTEIIANYLKEYCEANYNYTEILEVCEIVENYLMQNLWGYSLTRLLPAIHKTAYKYAIVLRNVYGFTFSEINAILNEMPENLRHRYTAENVNKIIADFKL